MTKTTETKPELTKAQIASRAQAAAHKQLRQAHPEEYRLAYDQAKQALAG